MIQPLQDYFIVEIERRYNDQKTKSGIFLLNAAWIDDTEMDRFQYKRIYGNVLSVPEGFSENPYRAIDDGMPAYRKFVGHDAIADRINRGYNNHTDKVYYPSTFDEYDVVTMRDIAEKVYVKKGDKAYFMPQVTERENLQEKDGDREVYKVDVTQIFAVFADQRIYTQGEWVLIKPDTETWDDITTKSGIITKSKPDRKWLTGVVAYSHYEHLVPGRKIVYLPNADCDVEVEGEKLCVMPVQDVIGELLTKNI